MQLDSIQEVIKIPRITRLPNTCSHVLGIYNLRGNIISLFDMQQILGLDSEQPETMNVVLVIGAQNYKLSFLVERVMDFIEVETNKIEAAENGKSVAKEDFVKGVYQHESMGEIFILDSEFIKELDNLVETSA